MTAAIAISLDKCISGNRKANANTKQIQIQVHTNTNSNTNTNANAGTSLTVLQPHPKIFGQMHLRQRFSASINISLQCKVCIQNEPLSPQIYHCIHERSTSTEALLPVGEEWCAVRSVFAPPPIGWVLKCSHLLKKSVRTSGLIVRPATLSNQDTSAFRVIVTPSKTDRWSWFACSAGCVGTAGSSNAPLLEPIVTCGWSANFGRIR